MKESLRAVCYERERTRCLLTKGSPGLLADTAPSPAHSPGATDQAGGKSTADGLEAGGSSGDDGKKGREAPPEPACCSVDWYKKYL